MGERRRQYAREFEAEAVKLAQTSGRSPRQVAKELGISNETLGTWVREAGAAGPPLSPDERAELVELRRQVKVLESERDPEMSRGLLRLGDRPDPVSVFRFVGGRRRSSRWPPCAGCWASPPAPTGPGAIEAPRTAR